MNKDQTEWRNDYVNPNLFYLLELSCIILKVSIVIWTMSSNDTKSKSEETTSEIKESQDTEKVN